MLFNIFMYIPPMKSSGLPKARRLLLLDNTFVCFSEEISASLLTQGEERHLFRVVVYYEQCTLLVKTEHLEVERVFLDVATEKKAVIQID